MLFFIGLFQIANSHSISEGIHEESPVFHFTPK